MKSYRMSVCAVVARLQYRVRLGKLSSLSALAFDTSGFFTSLFKIAPVRLPCCSYRIDGKVGYGSQKVKIMTYQGARPPQTINYILIYVSKVLLVFTMFRNTIHLMLPRYFNETGLAHFSCYPVNALSEVRSFTPRFRQDLTLSAHLHQHHLELLTCLI